MEPAAVAAPFDARATEGFESIKQPPPGRAALANDFAHEWGLERVLSSLWSSEIIIDNESRVIVVLFCML